MILWDVNLWVYAFRSDSPHHPVARAELEDASRRTREAFLFCPHVAASFLSLVTNERIFAQPSQPEEAWSFIDVLESRDDMIRAEIDPMTFGIFKHLCLISKAMGHDVPDALLASIAIRHDATLVTMDRGFERFAGLAWRIPEGVDI
jgi:toxin-antitoxin system PIN domain toxin